jgi:hypothetical protein
LPVLIVLGVCMRAFGRSSSPCTAQGATLAGRHGLRLLELLILKDLHDTVLVGGGGAARGVQRMKGVIAEGVNGGTKELHDTILGAELAAKLC